MSIRDFERERTNLEKRLSGKGRDFVDTYLAVCDLRELLSAQPQTATPQTIAALRGVLEERRFSFQTQAFFLYREAADALVSAVIGPSARTLREEAIGALKQALVSATGYAHRAVAGALGSMPLSIPVPELREQTSLEIPHVRWHEVMAAGGVNNGHRPISMGRSLLVSIDTHKLLIVKTAQGQHALSLLKNEAAWMAHLCSGGYSFPVRFNIPAVIKIRGSCIWGIEDVPIPGYRGQGPDAGSHAIGFVAHTDYFTYPNQSASGGRPANSEFYEVMCRNAWLLGRLAALGIIHTASIPLFHNRVQGHRRADHGFYEWPRAGRLDRWLASCRYPNFGLTGLRDFEHLIPFDGSSERLYRHVGTQIISLLLVAGSFFRNKDPERVGFDTNGKPVDARDLFEEAFLKELIHGIFTVYYEGFVGAQFVGNLPFDAERLASRMIEEMGIDRHMEETLRVVDQRAMSDDEFRSFLRERGCPEQRVKEVRKGVEDINLMTGPHLGGFNEAISLPELIETVGTISALCIAGKHRRQNFSEPLPKMILEIQNPNI